MLEAALRMASAQIIMCKMIYAECCDAGEKLRLNFVHLLFCSIRCSSQKLPFRSN